MLEPEDKFRHPIEEDDYQASGLEDDGDDDDQEELGVLTDEDAAIFNEDAEG